jgi:hypothetical protein
MMKVAKFGICLNKASADGSEAACIWHDISPLTHSQRSFLIHLL